MRRRQGNRTVLAARLAMVILLGLVAVELGALALRQHQLQGGTGVAVATPGAPGRTSTVPTTPVDPVPATSTTAASGPPTTVASAPGIVSYTLDGPTQVQVSVNQLTWLEARKGSGGPVLSEGLIDAGKTKTFSTPVWLRFGNTASVSVTAAGAPLQLPPPGPGDLLVTAG